MALSTSRVMGKQVPQALGFHLRMLASLSLSCSGLPALLTTWKCLTPAKYVLTELYQSLREFSDEQYQDFLLGWN